MKNFIIGIFALLFLPFYAQAQFVVSGVVSDESGETLPGVNIVIKGTNSGTMTNISGEFKLTNVIGTDVLEVSFIGFETQTIPVKDRSKINVTLVADVNELDEVLVIGYGTSKKKDITGSVATVSSEDLVASPTANYDEALMGRVAGVHVSASEGAPGAPMNIVIRGGNSITGSNQPLYVVDGIPLDDFDPATINTEDIQEFNVLKDASATSIYGSRGANGVIVITTKDGGNNNGTTTVTVSAAYGMQSIPKYLEVMSPYEYVKYQESQAWASSRWDLNEDSKDKLGKFYEKWVDPELYRDIDGNDWQDQIFQEAPIQRYNVSVNGGNKKTNIYYSGNYTDQEGTLITSGFTKLINNLRIKHTISKKATFNAGIMHSYSVRRGPDLRENNYSSIIRDAVRFRPVDPVLDDGLEPGGYDPTDPNQQVMYPPVPNLENTERKNKQNAIRGNMRFVYKFHKNLTLNLAANYQAQLNNETLFYGEDTRQGQNSPLGIQASQTQSLRQTLASSNTLTYHKKSKNHEFSVMGGIEGSYQDYSFSSLQNGNLPVDEFGMANIGIGTTATLAQSNWTGNTLLSYFGRATYAFKDKYLLTANFRADGSSKFADGNKWGYFPSLSGAWRAGDEPFLKNIEVLSTLKFRGGWGITGNNRIADFAAFNQINISKWSGYNWGVTESYQPGAIQSNLAVPDLRWETTEQVNFGLDLSFFNQRLETTVDVYQKNTTDLLLNANMAPSTGFRNVFQNVGEVENKGLEISLSTVNIHKKSFKWTTNFNISFQQNRVVKLNQGNDAIYSRARFDEDNYITQVGNSVGMMYGLEFERIYQVGDFNWNNETQTYELKDGVADNGSADVAPGGVKFIDQNGDGTINELDRKIIGNPHPDHFGGITNNFSYKGFNFSFLFQWSHGFDVMNGNAVEMHKPWGSQSFNGFSTVADHWTPYNTDTNINASTYAGSLGAARVGNQIDNRFIEDGSYIRLKTVTFGYSLPKKVLKRMKMKGLNFSVSGQNLFTWTSYSGFDPEVSVSGNGVTPNLDYSAYPQSRTILGSIKLTL
ncbi:SusC/RagA family TonB-linked outer membrane protein [Flammeovirga kamogawensis]|uniref:TonB-dependent receptor n=1 Tax=Flammeovirga kamogawensis TaxID=373891 RepID=A0ABX8H1X8_9BACT|nr:TonB-dependent receptor [Flammeovirga kamogawensis]MBB6462287.1 TonB-linked SusC/RagA family outer membrane protein [Flammeovirga kamogawensis]QWG09322.1 TonB-dependent receptor [Flammeovirga kamogawensis]TRX64844.1 TonB-dependent receptor [Flammeovirga kamogawensis]